ncbi:type I R-M system S protein [Treponema denticola]
MNDNLEQQAQAIFKAWFVDFEPFGGVMPDDWKVYKLGEFLPVITGKKNANISSAKGLYPFFSCSHDINWTDEYSFDGYAILVAGNGDFNVKWYNGKFEAYQRTYVLIPHNPRYTSWLYYAVKHNLSDITRVSRGSVISFITKSNLEDFSFVAPKNLEKFNLIDKFISINEIIDNNIKEIYRLTSLRDTLLPKLMSGEIDVSNIEI